MQSKLVPPLAQAATAANGKKPRGRPPNNNNKRPLSIDVEDESCTVRSIGSDDTNVPSDKKQKMVDVTISSATVAATATAAAAATTTTVSTKPPSPSQPPPFSLAALALQADEALKEADAALGKLKDLRPNWNGFAAIEADTKNSRLSVDGQGIATLVSPTAAAATASDSPYIHTVSVSATIPSTTAEYWLENTPSLRTASAESKRLFEFCYRSCIKYMLNAQLRKNACDKYVGLTMEQRKEFDGRIVNWIATNMKFHHWEPKPVQSTYVFTNKLVTFLGEKQKLRIMVRAAVSSPICWNDLGFLRSEVLESKTADSAILTPEELIKVKPEWRFQLYRLMACGIFPSMNDSQGQHPTCPVCGGLVDRDAYWQKAVSVYWVNRFSRVVGGMQSLQLMDDHMVIFETDVPNMPGVVCLMFARSIASFRRSIGSDNKTPITTVSDLKSQLAVVREQFLENSRHMLELVNHPVAQQCYAPETLGRIKKRVEENLASNNNN